MYVCMYVCIYQESKAVKCAVRLGSIFNRTPCISLSVTRGTRSMAVLCSELFVRARSAIVAFHINS